ncbi:hypothetical protein EHF36_14705 [Kerstersia gyiorum]|uniref:hypothetical protein n=1 Tax=Kerstersia gyiorum TaxID=206506 RepID=UPI001070EA25|nr:hypothetical protein [Kerstersia gyiorum]QBR41732.1 hypothetical protein EHF36_14705 [Kerstersia gyiorum]
MSAPVIAALDAGTYYHHRTFQTPGLAACLDYTVYVRELDAAALAGCDTFIVSCASPVDQLVSRRSLFRDFLQQGRTLVVMGGNGAEQWLDGVRHVPSPVNFWWWKEPRADSGLRLVAPEHDLFQCLTLADATWHQHGAYEPPPGVRSLIDKVGAGSVLYDDRQSTPGRLILTSLDPMYHHGSHFMPATTRFLHAFLPWLKRQQPAGRI